MSPGERGEEAPGSAAGAGRVGAVVSLAWPAALSFLLNNVYRINDQFWIQGLGGTAQAAIGATFFVVIMNFALVFLSIGGTLALVARTTGARAPVERDSVTRHALYFSAAIGLGLTVLVRPFVPEIVALLGLEGPTAGFGRDYLSALYLFYVPLAVTPTVDNVFFGRGNTRIPMALQVLAVTANYCLNPILIYGAGAAEAVSAPGVGALSSAAALAGLQDGYGIAGAAAATGISRLLAMTLGLLILWRGYGTALAARGRPRLALVRRIARIGVPSAVSIGIYAAVYWLLLRFVLARLEPEVIAGLGIGFQVFEGCAFPCYLGVSIAGASLVGQALGARDPTEARAVVRSTRAVGRAVGLAFTLLFLLAGRHLVPVFTQDPRVAFEASRYVFVLAFSQYWVAVEAVNERVLLGSGHTREILWIGPLGNVLRVPLALALALPAGLGAAGVWWAINATTYLKAGLYWWTVERGGWLRHEP